MKTVGIIFAMNEELIELKKYIDIKNEIKIYDLTFFEVFFKNVKCVIVESGVGKVNSARCTQIMIDKIGVDYIFNIGVAGAVSNKLNVCDIVLAKRLVQHDFDITGFNHEKGYIPNTGIYIDTDEYLFSLATNVLRKNKDINYSSGVIATGDIFCTDKKMGKKINSKFDALCVEMEGASIAQVCHLSNIPFLVIRSISDTPNNNNVLTYEEFLNKSSKVVANIMVDILTDLK